MESLKEHYTPLLQTTDSTYSGSEAASEKDAGELFLNESCREASHAKRSGRFTKLLVWFLLVATVLQSITITYITFGPQRQCKQSLGGAIVMKDVYRQRNVPTVFTSENETEAAAAWEAIEAGHGEVSVDPEWAVAQGLPPTMVHPFDKDKVVYTVAAYHEIHCVKIIRKHYLALLEGKPLDWPLHHDLHCFDSLRQSIMCSADDNLMYATGHRDVGAGQVVQCKDWDALRKWASDRTACYHDTESPPKKSVEARDVHLRWGHCDGGDDGLPRGSLLG